MGAIWNMFLDFIFAALQYFYGWVGDWGWAIILLTIVMRLILTPLTWKQTKSMYELQRIQPKLKELQTKYKGDKEKLQEETLKFYQENKVNPFGGCLPLIAQMPIFIGLYNVLGGTLEKPGKLMSYLNSLPAVAQATAKEFSVGPITILEDITMSPQRVWAAHAAQGIPTAVWATLPYVIFVILFGLSIWLPQYMMTQDTTQRRTGTYMAVFMLWIGWISPAGVLIYWVTSSAWQVGQQMLTTRMLDRRAAEAEAEAAAAKGKKLKGKAEDQSDPKSNEKDEDGSTGGKAPAGSKSKGKKKSKGA